MTDKHIKNAVEDYLRREKPVLASGAPLRPLMDAVAADHGMTYEQLRDGILDHTTTLGAG